MLKKWLPQKGIFSIPLIREITFVLVVKLVVIFTIKYFYFSDPIAFSADHLFGEIKPLESPNSIDTETTNN